MLFLVSVLVAEGNNKICAVNGSDVDGSNFEVVNGKKYYYC